MTSPQTPDNARRKFIAAAGAGVAGLGFTAIAPGLHLMAVGEANAAPTPRKAGEPANPAVRWGLLIDANKCAPGCTKCIDACHTENGVSANLPDPRQNSQWIRKIELVDRRPGKTRGHVTQLPMMCQHCAEPPCVDVCPTGASMKRADGIVLVDRHTCIGCRYCMMACPYKARSFVHAPLNDQNPEVPRGKGCVESCTLCVHRIDKGQQPACVESCPEGAMTFGDLNDADSAIAKRIASVPTTQVRADLRLNPGVRYEGL
ncbi:MAG: 4Fe-4S dicluster domain-containing protein [Sulfuritalea sp.]|nr:4Fe-4S dicluster domain-containing protein [Sulfuritalea sp.]